MPLSYGICFTALDRFGPSNVPVNNIPTAVAKAQAKNSKIGIACIIRRASRDIVNNITMSRQKNLDALESNENAISRNWTRLQTVKRLRSLAPLKSVGSNEAQAGNRIQELPCPRPLTLVVYSVPIREERNTLITKQSAKP